MTNQDLLKVQGIMRKGYGIIPKVPMQDKRLTPEAKGLYAYFRSFAGKGTTVFPSRDKIVDDMQMSKHRYYKSLNLLVQHGYLKVDMTTDASGRFKKNIYTLLEVAEENSYQNEVKATQGSAPCPNISETDEQRDSKKAPKTAGLQDANSITPCPDFSDTDQPLDSYGTEHQPLGFAGSAPCPNSPDTANQDTNNNIYINNNNNTIYSLSHSPSHSQVLKITAKKTDKDKDEDKTFNYNQNNETREKYMNKDNLNQKTNSKPRYSIQDYEVYRNILQSNMDYDYLIANNPYDTDFISSLVEIMLDTILTEEPKQVSIGKETKQREVVRSVFMKLSCEHIELVMTKFKEQSHKINNKTAYLRTMLYNSYLELDAHYTNQVKVDYVRKPSGTSFD